MYKGIGKLHADGTSIILCHHKLTICFESEWKLSDDMWKQTIALYIVEKIMFNFKYGLAAAPNTHWPYALP